MRRLTASSLVGVVVSVTTCSPNEVELFQEVSSATPGAAGRTGGSGGVSGKSGTGAAAHSAVAGAGGGERGSSESLGGGAFGGASGGTGATAGQAGGPPSSGESGGAGQGAVEPEEREPPAGNPDAACDVPEEAGVEESSDPRSVVGTGTPESCSGEEFISAVAQGGVVTFDCGPEPVTITLERTAKIVNHTGPKIVIDGGGLVTLSGAGRVRILYQNTCDEAQIWTTERCKNQDHPELTIQNLTFVDGYSEGSTPGDGGGAIFVLGGRLKVVNSRFFRNQCDPNGSDVSGGAIFAWHQHQGRPVYVVNSTFGGGASLGNACSNGGGLSGIGVSYTVINSVLSHNRALGLGAKPARSGTPGGGNGGAIHSDGDTYTLSICGTELANNTANEGGGAVYLVSNDRTGGLLIRDSVLTNNPSGGLETAGFPGVFALTDGVPQVEDSLLE